MKLIPISGNTYPVKEQLKALGAKWNAENKCWMIDPAKQQQALKIVESAGPAKPISNYTKSDPMRERGYCNECGEKIRSKAQRCWETGGFCCS
jgi:hypothetical protein